jgi:hypothetical protein
MINIFNFLIQILQRDVAILKQIETFEGDVYFGTNSIVVIFSLPGLYQILNMQDQINYSEFRQNLYQSKLNSQLGKHAAKVDVYQPATNVDKTLYYLERIE